MLSVVLSSTVEDCLSHRLPALLPLSGTTSYSCSSTNLLLVLSRLAAQSVDWQPKPVYVDELYKPVLSRLALPACKTVLADTANLQPV